MKMFKRIISFIMVAFFAFSPIAGGGLELSGFAADDILESPILPIVPADPEAKIGLSYIFDDTMLTAKVIDFNDDQATAVVIPSVVEDGGKSYTVTAIAGAAFSAEINLQTLVLPETVKTIEAYAFDSCTNLQIVWFAGDKAAFELLSVAAGNEAFLNAEVYYDACMDSEGPEFTHVYDSYNDPECNTCGEKREIEEAYVPGDLDEKEGVDLEDAVYLLYHVNFPGKYPVTQNADFDGSGVVDLDDVFYLLYHINFPSRYPLS